MGNSDSMRGSPLLTRTIGAGRLFFLLALVTVFAAFSRPCPAGSIFDDDFTPAAPAKPSEKPAPSVAPDTTPAPQPNPANPQPTPEPTPQPKPAPDVPPPAAANQRLPIPNKDDLLKSRKLFKQIFAKELKDGTAQGHRALAAKLIQEAQKVKDAPTDEYVLLAGAIQSAQLGSQLAPCIEAANAMGETFNVDPLRTAVNSALTMPLQASPPAISIENCQRGLELVTELTSAGDNETAIKLLSALRTAAASDPAIRQDIQGRLKELEAARKTTEELGLLLAKLKASPNDPAANLAVGENLCFVRDEWAQGLPCLVKGSDPELKALAARDLANPTAAADMAALGNDWWDAAAKRDGAIKNGMRTRGYTLLSTAIRDLKGLQMIAVEKRLAESPFLGIRVGKVTEIKTGHGPVRQVAFAPDGHLAFSSGDDGKISLWNLLTGQEVRTFDSHSGPQRRLAVAATGRVFASTNIDDNTVRLWDMDSGKELHQFGFGDNTGYVAISPDDTKLLFASNQAEPFIGLTATFQSINVPKSEGNYAGAWSPSGHLFAIGGWNGVAHVYDAATLKDIADMKQEGQVYFLAFTPDDKKVLSVNPNNKIFVFDIRSGKLQHAFDAGAARSIAITPDSRYMLAPNGEPRLFFWDLATGKPSDRFEGEQTAVTSAAISKDGRLALSGDNDGSIRVWRLPTGP